MRETLAQLEPLASRPGAYAAAVLLGLLWGSFANVCIYRWPPTDAHPRGRSVVTPGSHCGSCQAPIRWYDNVPLLSYLWLRGRCRACGAGFSPRYLVVEALTGALFGVAWWAAVSAPALFEPFDQRLIRFGIYAAFLFVLVVISFIDLDHMLILDRVALPSGIGFYALGLLLPERSWRDGLIGAAVGYGVIWLISEGYYRVTGRDGLGLGDASLMAVVGALLGWQGVYMAISLGSFAGVVTVVPALLVRRAMGTPPSGGPAVADGASPPEGASAPAAASPPASPEAGLAAAAAPDLALGRVAVPFGPFLAMGAAFYLLAAPWLTLKLSLLGG